MSNLKNVITLCKTDNIWNESPYDIAQNLIHIGICFWNRSPKVETFVSVIYSTYEYPSVICILIKEINSRLKYKWAFHLFNFIQQKHDWIENNKEDANIDQNTQFNETRHNKHPFMWTYKMHVIFLDYLILIRACVSLSLDSYIVIHMFLF